MEVKKLKSVVDLNKLQRFEYTLSSIDEDSLLITGDRGYPNYLYVEIKFEGTEYISCPISITDPVIWGVAEPNEAKKVIEKYSDNYRMKVFSIEEDFSIYYHSDEIKKSLNKTLLQHIIQPPQRSPYKFYIVAYNIDITLFYTKEVSHFLQSQNLLEDT